MMTTTPATNHGRAAPEHRVKQAVWHAAAVALFLASMVALATAVGFYVAEHAEVGFKFAVVSALLMLFADRAQGGAS